MRDSQLVRLWHYWPYVSTSGDSSAFALDAGSVPTGIALPLQQLTTSFRQNYLRDSAWGKSNMSFQQACLNPHD
jgi:hypothetical protein